MNHQQARIYLLRHGEVTPQGLLCGRTDVPLSTTGWQQLNQATDKLPTIDLCFSSPLQRCLAFAKQFMANQQTHSGNGQLIVKPALQEMHFGDWDGKAYKTLWSSSAVKNKQAQQTSIGSFWQNPWQHTPPNGEAMVAFHQRVQQVWQTIVSQAQGNNVLVVTHAGVIKQLLAEVLGLAMPTTKHIERINISYASLITINVHYDSDAEGGAIWPSLTF